VTIKEDTMTSEPLLGAGDPAPFTWINLDAGGEVLLTCDHASCAVPASLDGLGLSRDELRRHIGWDIGIEDVVRRMAAMMAAPAIVAGFSRLVIDLNRPHDSTRQPGSIPEVSDHTAVPANKGISTADAEARADALFRPYHNQIIAKLDAMRAGGVVPAYIAMHSFTPVMDGFERPWHIGVCWEHDGRIPVPMIAALRENPDLCVGDNEPYAIEADSDYGIPVHAAGRGLPHLLIEIRQDLIAEEAGQARWADIMVDALGKVLADRSIFAIKHFG
jgi:predicted N-formylglutamate amidohydrolase